MTLPKKYRYLSRQTWIIETVSMISSVSCLSAIVGILATMHDRPLSDWSVLLSVTATVSVLITVSKSLLLLVVASCISQRKWEYFRKPRPLLDFDTFDGASRGPLGALELLFGRARHAKTAALGAFITTIVLAWDPSAQSLIELETRSVATWEPEATFNYSTIYDSGARIGPDGYSCHQYETDNMGIGLHAFLHENITALSAIAYTMTNHVRGTRNSTIARGWSYRDEIFVTVQWGWSVVHIVTVVASVALLVIMYVTHMRAGRPAWKSGSVVLLLHWISGMDVEKWRAIEGCEAVEDYEKAVDDYVESLWVRASTSETFCLEKVDPQAGEEEIPLITQVGSTAPKVPE